tara:strand:- start:3118 stop:3453 length:336 start_codon:yes stop_codon:yes gene_type:complete
MDEAMKEKITQLQLMEQRMQANLQQKQQLQARLVEIDSALTEIENKDEAYKIIGNIMVKTDPKDLKKDLSEKKEVLTVRVGSIDKQEGKLKEQAESLQKEVQEAMKGGENG